VNLPKGWAWVRIVAYVVLAALGYHFLTGSWSGTSDADAATTLASENLLHGAKAFHDRIATLSAKQATASQTAQHWRTVAESLTAHVDTVAIPVSDTVAPKVIAGWKVIANAEHQSASACFVSLAACDTARRLLTARVDSLTARLSAQVQVGSCKFLFLTCPSRIRVAELFFVLGLAGGVIAAHH
jgi:hypothetical protein